LGLEECMVGRQIIKKQLLAEEIESGKEKV
jgi:hypothetical protein